MTTFSKFFSTFDDGGLISKGTCCVTTTSSNSLERASKHTHRTRQIKQTVNSAPHFREFKPAWSCHIPWVSAETESTHRVQTPWKTPASEFQSKKMSVKNFLDLADPKPHWTKIHNLSQQAPPSKELEEASFTAHMPLLRTTSTLRLRRRH